MRETESPQREGFVKMVGFKPAVIGDMDGERLKSTTNGMATANATTTTPI